MSLVPAWRLDLQQYRRKSKHSLGFGRVRCDAKDFVYVADAEAGTVYKFDSDAILVAKLPIETSRGRLTQPRDVAIDSEGNMFVSDLGGSAGPRIVEFDRRGRQRAAFPLDAPAEAIAVDSRGFLYLHVPTSHWRVEKLTSRGDHVASFGPRPKENRTPDIGKQKRLSRVYERLSSIAVDGRDRVYFAPAWSYDVCQFAADNKVKRHFKRQLDQAYPGGVSSQRTPWSVVVFDIAIPPGTEELYVLRAGPSKAGGALVDLWSPRGGSINEISLADWGYSLACDLAGNLYLLDARQADRKVRLSKYVRKQ